jgi:hypothetical protein
MAIICQVISIMWKFFPLSHSHSFANLILFCRLVEWKVNSWGIFLDFCVFLEIETQLKDTCEENSYLLENNCQSNFKWTAPSRATFSNSFFSRARIWKANLKFINSREMELLTFCIICASASTKKSVSILVTCGYILCRTCTKTSGKKNSNFYF